MIKIKDLMLISIIFAITWGCDRSQNFNPSDIEGLVAFYPFSKNAEDKSMNSFDGEVFNAQLVKDRYGKDSSAYYFNGDYSFINIGDIDELRIRGDLSISFWINSDTFEGLSRGIINCQANNTEDSEANALYKINFNSKNVLSYVHENGTGVNVKSDFDQYSFNTNQWYHITVVRSSEYKSVALYVNGVLRDLAIFDLPPDSGELSTIRIGENHGTVKQERFFKGKIDDVRFYNRRLSDKEVSILFSE